MNMDMKAFLTIRQERLTSDLFQWINSATLTGHTAAIDTLACMRSLSIDSSKDDLVATGSGDGTIKIWRRSIQDENTGNLAASNYRVIDVRNIN